MFRKKSNLSSIHCSMLARLCNLYVVFLKSSDKLLNYLLFDQTLSEVKMNVIGDMMEVTPIIGIDPQFLPLWISTLLSLTRSND